MVFAIVWTARITTVLMMAHTREKIMMLQTYFPSSNLICMQVLIYLVSVKVKAVKVHLLQIISWKIVLWHNWGADVTAWKIERKIPFELNLGGAPATDFICHRRPESSGGAMMTPNPAGSGWAPLGRIQQGSYTAACPFLARQQFMCDMCRQIDRGVSLLKTHRVIQG